MSRPLLVLDMDQTLVHYTKPRPHLKAFLRWAFRNFDVAIWTAANRNWYCTVEMLILGPMLRDLGEDFVFVWTQENLPHGYEGRKPLWLIWQMYPQWHPGNTFFVDDRALNFVGNPTESSVWVAPYVGQTGDKALLAVKEEITRRMRGKSLLVTFLEQIPIKPF